MKIVWILALIVPALSVAQGQDLAKQVCSADKHFAEYNYNSANVIFGGSLSIRNLGSGGLGCGSIYGASMQYFEAVRFALNFLNNANSGQGYLPGVTFGIKLYDACFSSINAVHDIQKLFPQSTTYQPYCSNTSPKAMLGMIGPFFSSTAPKESEYAKEVPVTLMSSSAMSTVLSDSVKYPTFFRTISSLAVHMRGIAAVLSRLQFKKVLAIYTSDNYGSNSYQQLIEASKDYDICVSQAIKLPYVGTVNAYVNMLRSIGTNNFVAGVISAVDGQARDILQAIQQIPELRQVQWIMVDLEINNPLSPTNHKQMRGSLIVMPKVVPLASFRDYFVDFLEDPSAVADNPWFKEWYEKVYSCTVVPGNANGCIKSRNTFLNSFKQSAYVVSSIKAVFAYVKAFESFCPSGTGMCQAILEASPEDVQNVLRTLDYTFQGTLIDPAMAGEKIKFDVNGDTMDTIFSVIQYNNDGSGFSFKELGDYQNGQLTMNLNPIFYDSNRDNVLTAAPRALCATAGCVNCIMPPSQVRFHYMAGDVVIASLINAHMHSDSLFQCGPNMESRLASIIAAQWAVGEYKRTNSNKLQGVSLGSLVADVCPTGAVATGFLSDLFSSSNNIVDGLGIAISSRQNIYGFVDDTDEMMADAISPILGQYKLPEIQVGATGLTVETSMPPLLSRAVPNEKSYFNALTSLCLAKRWTYLQVLTKKTLWYESMAERFRAHAAREGICVVSTSYFNDGSPTVLNQLLSNPDVSIVVTFGTASNIKDLFDAIKSSGNSGKLLILSGMARWGTDPSYFDMATSDPEHTITLGPRMQKNTDFENYLRGLTQSEIIANPFLTSLYEVSNKCSLISASRSLYSRACSPTEIFSPYQGNVPYLIQAIYNMADKLHEIIVDVCKNPNYNGLCVEFRGMSDIPERLGRELKNSVGIVNGEGTDDIMYYVVKNGVYVQSGFYSTKEQHLGSAPDSNLLGARFNDATFCSGVCLKCQYLFSYKDIVYRPGDYLIAGTFSVSAAGPVSLQPYVCGELNTKHGPLFTTDMLYAIDQVNNNKAPVSVKGLNIGGLALDHCHNSGREKLIVSDIYSGFLHHSMDVDETKILSWITDTTGSTQEAADLLDVLDIPIVSPSASSESLMNDYDNVFRTIQGDMTTATALVKIARQLGFPYIQVVHAADSFAENYKDTLVSAAETEGICVTAALKFSDPSQASSIVQQLMAKETNVVVLALGSSDINSLLEAISFDNTARNSLVIMTPDPIPVTVSGMTYPPISLQLQTSVLSNYKEYLDNGPVNNVFFAKYYMKLFQCNLEGYYFYSTKCTYPLSGVTSHSRFEYSSYTLSTINAVYSIVEALDRTLKDYCGSDYTAPCPSFLQAPDQRQQLIQNLIKVRFIDEGGNDFRFLQREGNVAFNILQFSVNDFKQVGSIAGGTLNLGDSFNYVYKNVISRCNVPCLECINKGLNFSLTPGDIYLGGLFDVHQTNFDPFSCGRINTLHGFLLLEAFHYALDQVNSNKGPFKDILNGVDLGGVGLDACSSQVRGGQLVSNINNDLTPLTKQGKTVDASNIDAYIGSYASSSTQYLARILNDLEIPQISYAAGSNDLSDLRIYPFFFRTIPSNAKQAEAMLAYLNERDIRYIQILYVDNSFGNSGKDELIKRAAEYKICVAQTVEYTDGGIASTERSKAVVTTLLEKPAANTVVTFLETSYINSVLRAIRASDRAHNKLRFVGSDIWADNKEAIEQAEEYAVDSVTLKLDADDVEEFENYINSKTLANSDGNPWFEEYYQEIHNCYTTISNPHDYSRPCSQSISSIISSVRYQQDPNVINVINAVFAAAFSIHQTLKDLCGDNYHTVCQAYRNNIQRRYNIRDNLAKVQFMDNSDKMFKFTKDREVDINYRFNAISRGPLGEVIYKQIGIYNSSSKSVQLSDSYSPSHPWNSGCDREDACEECPAIRDSTVRYTFLQSPNTQDDDLVIVAFFDIHEQGVDPYRCGKLNVAGFQQFLAFFYSIDKLFTEEFQGPNGGNRGIRVLAVDTCSNPVRLDQDLFGLLEGTGLCNTDNFVMPGGFPISAKNIAAVVASGELNTMAAARLLEKLGITYISPNAKSPLLDDKTYLARTTAPISAQMRSLSKMVLEMGWEYMDVIYEEKWLGYYQWQSFSHQAAQAGLCLASPFVVSDGTKNQDIENIMKRLNLQRGSKVVVLFGGKSFFGRIIAAARNVGVVKDYIWILGGDMEIDDGFIKSISSDDAQIISFHRLSDEFSNFKDHVAGLGYPVGDSKLTNDYIPRGWFEDFFQMMKDCTISSADKPINIDKNECIPGSSISLSEQDEYLVNTAAAAYTAVSGIRKFLFGASTDLGNMNNRIELRKIILGVKFNLRNKKITTKDMNFDFTIEQWWEPKYDIKYWMGQQASETIDHAKKDLNVTSMCLETEDQGFCGCDVDTAFTAQFYDVPDFVPSSHRNYYKFDSDGSRKFDWPVWAIAMAVLTGLGLLVTIVIFLILLCAYPKKGGTSILGYMMIIGIIGIYAINFAFFLSATEAVCGIRRFLMGVVYTICFAPLLIKAIDNWRFGHVDYAERRYSGISSSCALLMSAIAVVLIQCIIPIMWLILEHPGATDYSNTGNYGGHHDNDWCDPAGDYDLGLVLSFSFVVFIILITGIFSALSYGSETNNFESRWILFASIATAGCFLVWMIVTTNARAIYRDPAVAIANFSNATILLIIIPLRKTGLMMQARRNKDEKNDVPINGNGPYDMYSDSYINPQYELTDYNEDYLQKPSEF